MIDDGHLDRLRELAARLVASGPKAAHVSASECQEIAEGLVELIDEVQRLGSQMARATAKRDFYLTSLRAVADDGDCPLCGEYTAEGGHDDRCDLYAEGK